MTDAISKTEPTKAIARSVAAETFAPMEGYDPKDMAGKEGITTEDLRLPFLSIAQKTSKALDATEDAYIPGLKLGDLYNSETKEIYGRGPIHIAPLLHHKSAYLPQANGRRGELVSWADPRCNWPSDAEKRTWVADGKKGKPKPEAVREYNWVVMLLLESGPQLAVVSFRSKSFGAGASLTTFTSMIQGPAFTGRFEIKTLLTENEAGKFGVFAVQPAGKPTADQAAFAKTMYESLKDRTIATEDVVDEDVDPTGDEATNATQPARTDDKIPF